MFDPNLQNIPRETSNKWASYVKECFVAPQGSKFWSRDFSGIEAVLVGYFAGSARYTRLAKLGVHAFLATHVLGNGASLDWSDSDLKLAFKEAKRDKVVYDTAKRIVHGSNYMMTPSKMQFEYPETFSTVKHAMELQGLYFELFPEIRQWHHTLAESVDGTRRKEIDPLAPVDPWTLGVAYAQNPFGYIHRFYNVLEWQKVGTEWVSSFGDDAKRLVSFLPQSTAAAIIKQAGSIIWYDYPWVGETMRLWIHDDIMGESGDEMLEECLSISKMVMEAPIPQLPLDPAWGMGSHLTIGSEAKVGQSWAGMKVVQE